MCLCRRDIHKSSSSSSTTSLVLVSPIPLVSNLKGQHRVPEEAGQLGDRTGQRDLGLPVDVVLDGQQVVGHGLQRQLVQEGGHGVEAAVQDQQLAARLVRTLDTSDHSWSAGESQDKSKVPAAALHAHGPHSDSPERTMATLP